MPTRRKTTRRRFLGQLGRGAAGLLAGQALLQTRTLLGGQDAPPAPGELAVFFDKACLGHDPGPKHPESPRRLTSIIDALRQCDFKDRLAWPTVTPATAEQLELCHDPNYVKHVRKQIAAGVDDLGTSDSNVSAGSWEAALAAAGAGLSAVDAVTKGTPCRAFCAVRPPGHHALADKAMGFCLFGNVALAARYAQRNHDLQKVLIVDWDVHHGNGTQAIFYDDPSVLFFSVHQSPWYPGTGSSDETGEGKGRGTTINVPLPAGTAGPAVLKAFDEKLLPAARTFKPELLLVSAGFDSRAGDPLGGWKLTDDDFTAMTKRLCDLADETADGRVISMLEGGYDLKGLARATTAHCKAMLLPPAPRSGVQSQGVGEYT
jgi:acetoin utilization deacetylase AcuC-like enzyme